MNVTGKAMTPAVITTVSNRWPRIVTANGSRNAVKNLPAVASAMTSAVRKTAAQTT